MDSAGLRAVETSRLNANPLGNKAPFWSFWACAATTTSSRPAGRAQRRALVLSVLATFLLAGCVSPTEIRQFAAQPPLPLMGEPRPIMFRKLVSKLPRGQEIGTVQGGLACVGQEKLFWKRGGRVPLGDEELSDTLKEELVRAGYRVVGDPASLFEDPHEWKAEFLLAGVVKHVAVNICYPLIGFANFTSSKGEASIEVEWQVYERRSRSVVLTVTTGGTARTDTGPEQGIQAYYEAFAAAVRNLLAEPRFVTLMTRQPSQPGPPLATLEIVVPDLRDAASTPELIEHARNAVVTIPIGSGHGSGVLISTAGLVLTNAHVVGEGSGMVTVELSTGRRVAGEVVRVHRDADLALIRLEKGRYLAAPIGSAERLRVGDPVFAIGAPLDERLSRTVTRGIVSGFRELDGRRLIQSDVTIHPGNSGGPVLDAAGRVVGVVHSGVVAGRTGIGLNFFIPIDDAWQALGLRLQRIPVTLGDLLSGRP